MPEINIPLEFDRRYLDEEIKWLKCPVCNTYLTINGALSRQDCINIKCDFSLEIDSAINRIEYFTYRYKVYEYFNNLIHLETDLGWKELLQSPVLDKKTLLNLEKLALL